MPGIGQWDDPDGSSESELEKQEQGYKDELIVYINGSSIPEDKKQVFIQQFKALDKLLDYTQQCKRRVLGEAAIYLIAVLARPESEQTARTRFDEALTEYGGYKDGALFAWFKSTVAPLLNKLGFDFNVNKSKTETIVDAVLIQTQCHIKSELQDITDRTNLDAKPTRGPS